MITHADGSTSTDTNASIVVVEAMLAMALCMALSMSMTGHSQRHSRIVVNDQVRDGFEVVGV
jgi:hypothetical protein